MAIPDSFELLEGSPFGELIGPLYLRESDSAPVLGVLVQPQHANRQGRAHGGLLMTLADVAVSRAAVAHLPPGSQIATATLQISFLQAVQQGEWLEARPTVDRLGRSLVHASCEIWGGGAPAGSAVAARDVLVARVNATVSVRLPVPE